MKKITIERVTNRIIHSHLRLILLVWICLCMAPAMMAQNVKIHGFGMVNNRGGIDNNGNTPAPIRVRTEAELRAACESEEPRVVELMQNINAGSSGVLVRSRKEIRPYYDAQNQTWRNVTFTGNFNIRGSDIIIHRLTMTQPLGGDAISIRGSESRRIAVYRCRIFNCTDDCLDVTANASDVTIAYCKFWNATRLPHRFCIQIQAGRDSDCRVTIHHNWFHIGLQYRVPRVGSDGTANRKAYVHLFNNYYSTSESQGQLVMTNRSSVIAEQNAYLNEYNPWDFKGVMNGSGQFLSQDSAGRAIDANLFVSRPCFLNSPRWSSPMIRYHRSRNQNQFDPSQWWLFLPPSPQRDGFVNYSYELTAETSVRSQVMAHAGSIQ